MRSDLLSDSLCKKKSHWIITINDKMNVWKCKLIFPTDTLQQKLEITGLKKFFFCGHRIDHADWSAVCNNLYFKCTSLGVHKLNYKLINRIYLSPLHLKFFYKNSSGLYLNCKKTKGNISSLFLVL